jgi:hypothetical protein
MINPRLVTAACIIVKTTKDNKAPNIASKKLRLYKNKMISVSIKRLDITLIVALKLHNMFVLTKAIEVNNVVNITYLNLTVSFLPRIVQIKKDNKNSSGIDMVKKFSSENCSIYYNSFPQKI